jgi:hypothetical protein
MDILSLFLLVVLYLMFEINIETDNSKKSI